MKDLTCVWLMKVQTAITSLEITDQCICLNCIFFFPGRNKGPSFTQCTSWVLIVHIKLSGTKRRAGIAMLPLLCPFQGCRGTADPRDVPGRSACRGEELFCASQQLSLRGHVGRHLGGNCSSGCDTSLFLLFSIIFLKDSFKNFKLHVCTRVCVGVHTSECSCQWIPEERV